MRRRYYCGLLIAAWAAWAAPGLGNDRDNDRDNPPPFTQGLRGTTSSPFEPPEKDDRTFVLNTGGGLDTGCSFRSDGPLVINLEVKRYAGPTNPDGTLRDAADLVQAGLLSKFATLVMPAYDVDFDAGVEPPDQPERDRVFFNGTGVKTLVPSNSEYLQGADGIWRLNSFQIPIEKVKFPSARGANGAEPAPAINEIRIDIDVANIPQGQELWCTAIDWVALSMKLMSPIILIHGNGSNGGFFQRQGFTMGLDTQRLLWDNSINMATSTIAANAGRLNTLVPPIAKSFGVDSVHFVVHSKGGLDSRDYLARFQPAHNNTFKVLSYTSLSTPHNGSVLADLVVTRTAAAARATRIEYVGFPDMTRAVAYLSGGPDAGTPDLQTTTVAAFNAANLGRLPGSVVYNTVAADADQNGNARIDNAPDEYLELRQESAELTRLFNTPVVGDNLARRAVDVPYQILRNTAGVTVAYRRVGIGRLGITIATITSVPNPIPLGNDVLVTIPSGRGTGGFAAKVTNTTTFTGAAGRNHSSVANAGVATTVGPWIIATERANGDLK